MLAGLVLIVSSTITSARENPDVFGLLMVGLALWLAWGVLIGWIITMITKSKQVPLLPKLIAAGWGFVSLPFSGWLLGPIKAASPDSLSEGIKIAIAAPIPEEAAKLLGVVLLAALSPNVLSRPTGAVATGFAAGLGFTVIENWFGTGGALTDPANAGSEAEAMVGWLVQRTLTAPWGHLAWTGFAAVGVWYVVAKSNRSIGSRIGVAISFFALAALLHGIDDAAVATQNFLLVIPIWLVDLAVFIALARWSRNNA